jgi:hypothetical protein
MVDFSKLNNAPLNTFEKPKPLPAGSYYGTIQSYKFDESKDKKTPFVEFTVKVTSAGDDVDQGELTGIDLSNKELRKAFYLTPAAGYQLTAFAEALGIDTGRGVVEVVPDFVSQQVLMGVIRKPNRDGTDFYNEVAKIGAA